MDLCDYYLFSISHGNIFSIAVMLNYQDKAQISGYYYYSDSCVFFIFIPFSFDYKIICKGTIFIIDR